MEISSDTPIYFEHDCALSGKEGFLMVKQALAENSPYAVILLDMRMPPGWDGVKTAKMIRTVDRNVRIIFCSAYSDYELEQLHAEVGVDFDYFRKPVEPKRLLQTALSLASCWSRFKQLEQHKTQGGQPLPEMVQQEGRYPVPEADKRTYVSVTDREGKIIYVNDLFCELTGYSRSELIGENHRIFNSGEHSEAFYQKMWEMIGKGEVWYGDLMDRRKDGATFWNRSMIIPVMDQHGEAIKFISLKYDPNDVQWMEQERQMALAFAKADRKRLSLVGDIIDMSKIESGTLDLDETHYSLSVLLKDIEHDYITIVHDAGLEFQLHPPGKQDIQLNGDAHRITQIIAHLLDNAVEFTHHGLISLTCWYDTKHLFFKVEDTGVGMSEKDLGRLKERIEQKESTFSGHGLGLYVAFQLARLMGGRWM